ncbi:MAG: thiamine phosphate synthase [Acidobacteriota bacterium]
MTFYQKKREIIEAVVEAVRSSVAMVQIREKQLTAKQVFELTSGAVAAAAGSVTLVLVNERFDIAMAAGADGVHLRSNSMSPADIRSVTPRGFIIGVSTHSTNDAITARDRSADFAVLGPVFATPGKPAPIGLEELRKTCELAGSFPILALGGIDASNVRSVIQAGAAGFAAIRFMNSGAGSEFVREVKNVSK